jgi:hypothetical protein
MPPHINHHHPDSGAGPRDNRRAAPDDLAGMDGTVASVERSLRSLLVAISRDYLHCGKAACVRSRRCRSSACEPKEDDAA